VRRLGGVHGGRGRGIGRGGSRERQLTQVFSAFQRRKLSSGSGNATKMSLLAVFLCEHEGLVHGSMMDPMRGGRRSRRDADFGNRDSCSGRP